MTCRVLVVDDEAEIGRWTARILEDEGFEARAVPSVDKGRDTLRMWLPHLVLLDVWFGENQSDGLVFLDEIRQSWPDLPVIMISGHGTIDMAVQAIRKGAFDFVQKPFNTDRLVLSVRRGLEMAGLRRENTLLKARSPDEEEGPPPVLGVLQAPLGKIAQSGSRVLVWGATGTGKETLARWIHRHSARAEGPFVSASCALLGADQCEGVLFGAEGGGAGHPVRPGLLEQAHGGTLYLSDIPAMPGDLQGRFARMLQDKGFVRAGGQYRIEVDVRVIASLTSDPEAARASGRLQDDLFWRLNVVPVALPPLSARQADIPALAEVLVQRLSRVHGVPARPLEEGTVAALQMYPWPGNIRQLRNVLEWMVIMYARERETLGVDTLPGDVAGTSPLPTVASRGLGVMTLPLAEARAIFERDYLLAQVNRFAGNISRTAEFVGMERSALHRKLKSLGAAPERSAARRAAGA